LITCLFFLHIFSKGNKIASVWGGRLPNIDVLYSYNSLSRENLFFDIDYLQSIVAILITGSIQTWSTVLNRMECNTEELVEARLKSFKDKVKLKKHSIGFMFTYTDATSRSYHQIRIQSRIFERLFSQVPLIGCFGYEQFGKTTIVDEVKKEGE